MFKRRVGLTVNGDIVRKKKNRFCVSNYVTAAAAVSSAIRIQKEFLYNDAFFGYLTIYIIIGTYLPTRVSRQT